MSELTGSAEPAGTSLLRLLELTDRLRRECPWNAQQTHTSLRRYLLEETYEVLEALDGDDSDALREELGDLLYQVYFHARIAAVESGWSIDDVASQLHAKLVRRHPHVFGERDVAEIADIEAIWDQVKATEKRRDSVLDGIPSELPALAYADKVLQRMDRAGLSGVAPVVDDSDPEQRIGAELLRLVVEARAAGVDPESALRQVTRDYARSGEA